MDTDGVQSTAAPRPGDPRSRGPRPGASWRDVAWLSLSTGLIVVTTVQLVAMTIVLVRVELSPSAGRLVLGFLITVVWLLTIAWFVMGAWRRTVWGCPFDHVGHAPPERRCQRHELIT